MASTAEWWEVILIPKPHSVHTRTNELLSHGWPEEPVYLRDDLWIGALAYTLQEQIFEACNPPCFGIKPQRVQAQLYSLVRECPGGRPSKWDEDSSLQTALALSRLILPNPAGTQFAAQVLLKNIDEAEQVRPTEVEGPSTHCYVAQPDERTWLSVSEAEELASLYRLYEATELPDRVKRAFWYHEYTFWNHFVDVRWPMVITGLEALIHTDRFASTRQFADRTAAMAGELAISGLDVAATKEIYDQRSRLVHGDSVVDMTSENRALYVQTEELLRQAVLRAIRDESFQRIFDADECIRNRWPIRQRGPNR